MLEILTSFSVVALAVIVGYVTARIGFLGPHAIPVLNRLVFNILAPFLMLATLAGADAHALLSSLLPVSAVAAVCVVTTSVVISAGLWRRDLGHVVVGALGSSYVNSNNIGIPIAVYLLGDAVYAAPVLLLQMVVIAPAALTILDAHARGRIRPTTILRSVFTNPIVVASLIGLLLSVTQSQLPEALLNSFELIGRPAVPLILIAFGMSLAGQRILQPGTARRDVVVACLLKLILMPTVAYLTGRAAMGLTGHSLYVVTVLAALPTAQNVFVYAEQYRTGQTLARDTIFLTTLGSVPVLLLIALLLG